MTCYGNVVKTQAPKTKTKTWNFKTKTKTQRLKTNIKTWTFKTKTKTKTSTLEFPNVSRPRVKSRELHRWKMCK